MSLSESTDPMYSSQQINIPPSLPLLLKQFTKAAIKTQPEDVLQWAAQYFEALAQGKQPPTSARLQQQSSSNGTPTAAAQPQPATAANGSSASDASLTVGRLRALAAELAEGPAEVPRAELVSHCKRLGFPEQAVRDGLGVGDFGESVPWMRFVALEAAELRPGLLDTLGVLVEALSEDGADGMPLAYFEEAYAFLAGLDDEEPRSVVDTVLAELADNATVSLDDVVAARSAAVANAGSGEGEGEGADLAVEGYHIDDEVRKTVKSLFVLFFFWSCSPIWYIAPPFLAPRRPAVMTMIPLSWPTTTTPTAARRSTATPRPWRSRWRRRSHRQSRRRSSRTAPTMILSPRSLRFGPRTPKTAWPSTLTPTTTTRSAMSSARPLRNASTAAS
jgi:hypothetical protein